MKYCLATIVSVMILGCSGNRPEDQVVYYYNLDSLLLAQKEILFEKKPTLEKWAYVDGDTSESTYEPDTTEWKNELAFFSKMNINKPVLQDVYEINERKDDHSNLTIREYKAPESKDVEVEYFRVYYLNDILQLKKIEALYTEDNPIYKSRRNFKLEFTDTKEGARLNSFSVEGSQKMILKDSVKFKVIGQIK